MTTDFSTSKVRAGNLPAFVAAYEPRCTCGGRVLAHRPAVWVRYRVSYPDDPDQCDACKRRYRWMAGTYGDVVVTLDRIWQGVVDAVDDSTRLYCTFHARGRHAARALIGYRVFHVGCQVSGAIRDDELRVRVIRAMRRIQPGTTATNHAVVAVATAATAHKAARITKSTPRRKSGPQHVRGRR